MPIRPVTGMPPLPLDSPEDAAVLVEALAQPGAGRRGGLPPAEDPAFMRTLMAPTFAFLDQTFGR